jgi:Ras-related GTP-binding protein A/B
MEVKNSKFSAFIDAFTTNTYIMVIISDPIIRKIDYYLSITNSLIVESAATLLNIGTARTHFEKFIQNADKNTAAFY